MSYGGQNIYELLGEEGEAQPAAKKTQQAETKPTKTAAAAPAQKTAAKAPAPAKKDNQRKFTTDRKPATGGSGFDAPAGAKEEHQRDHSDHRRGAKSHGSAEGTALGERQRDTREKRVYERRPANGGPLKSFPKKGGAGKGGWGTAADEEQQAVVEAVEGAEAAPVTPRPERELTEEEKAYRAEKEAEREREEKLMTVEEYLAKQKKVAVDTPKARAAGEGADNSQWKDYAPLTRVEEDETFLVGSKDAEKKKNREAKEEHEQDEKRVNAADYINFQSPKPSGGSDRGGRGGRGGGRGAGRGGRGGRGGSQSRGGKQGGGKQGAFNIEQAAFPELGAKASTKA